MDKMSSSSLHMKATMMKVSDPIIFGHCVESYLGEITDEYKDDLKSAGFNPNNGLSDFYRALETLDFDQADRNPQPFAGHSKYPSSLGHGQF